MFPVPVPGQLLKNEITRKLLHKGDERFLALLRFLTLIFQFAFYIGLNVPEKFKLAKFELNIQRAPDDIQRAPDGNRGTKKTRDLNITGLNRISMFRNLFLV